MADQDFIERTAFQGRKLPENLDMLLSLGIEHDDTYDSIKMQRVNAVVDYFKQYGDGVSILRRIALKAPKAERVDRLWEYMTMRKLYEAKKAEHESAIQGLKASEHEIKSLQRDIESFE